MPVVFFNAVLGAVLGIFSAHVVLKSNVHLQFMLLQQALKNNQQRATWGFQLLAGVIMGLVFALNTLWLGDGLSLYYWQVMAVLLLAAALYDLLYRLIPVWLVISMLVVGGLSPLVFAYPLPIFDALFGAVAVGGVVGLLYLFTRGRGIGEADVLLALVVGLMFGWMRGLMVFSAANFLGLLIVLPLIALLGKKRMRQIPLVFFIVMAMILEWYLVYTDPVLLLMGAS